MAKAPDSREASDKVLQIIEEVSRD